MNWWHSTQYRYALRSSVVRELEEDRSSYLNEMFGDTNRFVVPIESPFLQKIKALENSGYKIDLDKKTAYKKNILRDGSEKWSPMALGKLIGRTYGEAGLNEYSAYEEFPEASKYSVIFTKSAVDIARMSDHDDLHSCHAPGGSYFQCAIQEASDGGV